MNKQVDRRRDPWPNDQKQAGRYYIAAPEGSW